MIYQRESLLLNSHEIEKCLSSPVYADGNLSVFAVPVHPRADAPVPCSSHSGSLKRKNASDHASSSSPNKRKKGDDEDFDESRSSTIEDSSGPSDTATWNSLAVRPSDYSGHDAALWRRLVVQHMFPGNSVTAPSKGDTSLPKSLEPFGRNASVTMMQLNKPLPRLTRNLYALSYVVVGALGRGKFDAAKAESLGLKNGPLRGRLAKGETIVTADGQTITPDMVLGPAPPPDVRPF